MNNELNKEVDRKLTKAKIQLIINHPFFASLALGVDHRFNDNIPTARTDGKVIEYNTRYLEGMSIEEMQTLIAHEVCHLAFHHHLRMGNRDIEKWNIACDFAVNLILRDSGFIIGDGWLCDQRFEGMSSEEIYAKLPEMNARQDEKYGFCDGECPGDGSSDKNLGPGGVEPMKVKSMSEMSAAESDMNSRVIRAAMAAKQAGKLPAHLGHLVDKLLEPAIDWKSELSAFLTSAAESDYTWSRPARRMIHRDVFMPSLNSEGKGDFALMIDTSGSTFEPVILQRLASEVQSIVSEVGGRVRVIHVDMELQHVEEVDEHDDIDLNLRGGGGTDFRPGFEWLDKNSEDVSAVVYFTDGYCDSFPPAPAIPTLWCVYDNQSFNPPFGEVIHIPIHKIQEEEYAKY